MLAAPVSSAPLTRLSHESQQGLKVEFDYKKVLKALKKGGWKETQASLRQQGSPRSPSLLLLSAHVNPLSLGIFAEFCCNGSVVDDAELGNVSLGDAGRADCWFSPSCKAARYTQEATAAHVHVDLRFICLQSDRVPNFPAPVLFPPSGDPAAGRPAQERADLPHPGTSCSSALCLQQANV